MKRFCKLGYDKESFEMQYGCEKRNVESGLSIQRGFENFFCSKTDLSKILVPGLKSPGTTVYSSGHFSLLG